MSEPRLRDLLLSETASIKEAMRAIDRTGQRVIYAVDSQKRLAGVASDGEIRRAILRGVDVRAPLSEILNREPVVLAAADLKNPFAARAKARELLARMPDSRYALVVDALRRPAQLIALKDFARVRASKKAASERGRRVLVVGGAGYLGSILSRKLLSRGYRVRALDALLFGGAPVEDLAKHPRFELDQGDIRDISKITRALEGIDAVVNLGAIVGDPACKGKPEMAIETNYLANKTLADACRYHQINRFIFASTCSVYGRSDDGVLDEKAPLNPLSLYARSKTQSEEGIFALADENFSPTIMRMATLYGWSPRMRFDLVVNTMTMMAVAQGRVVVHGGGKQWRPLLHVEDAAEAFARCLEAPIEKVGTQIFNVGSTAQNVQIIDIARRVHKIVPKAKLIVQDGAVDLRDYNVSFKKIETTLDFRAEHGIEDAVKRIKRAIESGELEDVRLSKYYNQEP